MYLSAIPKRKGHRCAISVWCGQLASLREHYMPWHFAAEKYGLKLAQEFSRRGGNLGDGSDPVKLLNPAIPPQTVLAERLKALVLDWAGTTVDFGSVAPARTMQCVFASHHIELTEDEARQHMGLPKKDHI